MRLTLHVFWGLMAAAAFGCASGGGGSSTSGGTSFSTTSYGSSTSSSSGSPALRWSCGIDADGDCTCTNDPSVSGFADCSQAQSMCCTTCDYLNNDAGLQFCGCEMTVDPNCPLNETICAQQTLLYTNPQAVQTCPP